MRSFLFPKRSSPARAFVLLEVLVSLTILGLALAMVLRSFTNSLKATQRSQSLTTATILARDLIEEWEIKPPEKGFSRGDFGKDLQNFYYEVTYRTETVDYENLTRIEEQSRLVYLRTISLDVYHQSARDRREGARRRLLRVETALSSSERFALDARPGNRIGFDD